MELHIEHAQDTVICSPKGEVNIHHSPQLRKAFNELIRQDIKKVIVDFSSVTNIDTSGLATLIEMYHRLKKNHGHLKLANMSADIKKMFEILKLCTFFEIYSSREDAIKAFN